MAFDKTASSVDTDSKAVLLMTLDLYRTDDSRYVPNPIAIKFAKENAQNKDDRQNFKLSKSVDSVVENGHIVYLARIALEPGKYKLNDIFGNANAFPFNGFFSVPLYLDLTVKPHSVTYVGRVSAKLRPRQDNEFRAGPSIPLIDQAVTGISTSTWEVSTEDLSAKDIALFRANYPALNKANIEVAPLPAFDRALAQRLWEGTTPQEDQKTPVAAAATATQTETK